MTASVALVAYVDGHFEGTLNNPQQIVDALAELFPDVKPSPPKPKVGDKVRFTAANIEGEALAVGERMVFVRHDDGVETVWPIKNTAVLG